MDELDAIVLKADIEHRYNEAMGAINVAYVETKADTAYTKTRIDCLAEEVESLKAQLNDLEEWVSISFKNLCIDLGDAFRERFENGDFEISEEEFHQILLGALTVPGMEADFRVEV